MIRPTLAMCAMAMLVAVARPAAAQAGAATPQVEQRVSPNALAEQARRALQAGDYAQAISRYEQLRQRLPQRAEVPYNMGVAAFRSGEYQRASELFAQALSMAGEGRLRSDSAYNLGTSAYAQSLQAGNGEVQQQLSRIDEAQSELHRALKHYRQALDVNPDDADAKANAELAYRRLKALEQMKRQMQQSQNRQGETQQNQNQKPDQQQQQDQPDEPQNESNDRDRNNRQQQQQQPDQQRSQQQQQQDQQSQQASQPPPQQRDEQRSDQGRQDQSGSGQEGPPVGGDAEPDPIEPPRDEQSQSTPRPKQDDEMSRDEAEQLLQMIRDKERQRKKQQQQERASRRPPVDKDW